VLFGLTLSVLTAVRVHHPDRPIIEPADVLNHHSIGATTALPAIARQVKTTDILPARHGMPGMKVQGARFQAVDHIPDNPSPYATQLIENRLNVNHESLRFQPGGRS